MALIKMTNVCHLLGRDKLVQVFISWFDKDFLYLHKDYKHIPKTVNRKQHTQQVNKCIHDFNCLVEGIIWFCEEMTDKNQRNQLWFWNGNSLFQFLIIQSLCPVAGLLLVILLR